MKKTISLNATTITEKTTKTKYGGNTTKSNTTTIKTPGTTYVWTASTITKK